MLWRIIVLPLLLLSFFHPVYAHNEELIFSATGDVPYGSSEIPILMQQMADHNLYSHSEFLVHVGDIKTGSAPCTESVYIQVADILKELSVPVYIVPGDNEYNDCADPIQAWQWWSQYFMNFEDNFCGTMPTEHQGAQPENHAFVIKGVLMIGINLVGGRVHSQSEWNTRMQNDADWVAYQFQTKGSQVRAAVVYCQAGPNNSNRNLFYNQFRQSAAAFGKPVLLLHGDGHFWIYDKPFPEQNIYRIQVNMGGNEDPVQLTVNLDPVNPFVYLRNPWSNNPPLYNVMPCVEAGPDTTISLPDVAELHARTRDDGVPLNPGTITRTWSKVSGPGTVNFADPHADITTASFSAAGIYTLRMTANDGALQNYDDVVVTAIASGPLLVNVKTFLQGPYQGGGMNTSLRDNGKLPLAQPYNASPWNYNGSEAVDAIPAGVVDWVLVGLRSTANGAEFAYRAAFIKSDGSIAEISGSGGVEFAGVAQGNYFVVIYHRNHLGIMSNSALPLSEVSALYDFSTALTQAYGSNPMVEVETGVFGMISGDGNSDGTVNNADRLLWHSENGTPWSYGKGGDFNLDGGLDVLDLNYAWRANNGAISGVSGVVLSAGISGLPAASASK